MNQKTDYSQKASWYKLPEITRDVDTFYIYATEYSVGSFEEGAPDYATLDNAEMLEGVKAEYIEHASTFEGTTNVFVPYYRQAGLRYAGEIHKKTGNVDAALLGIPYDDIAAALDYYFENYNGGRPFIIAGHSQGSSMALLLLRTYFVTIHSRIALLMKLSGLKNRPDRNDPGIVPIRTICTANWRGLRDYGLQLMA